MSIIEIHSLSEPGIEAYAKLTDRELRVGDVFVAESPKVILTAIKAGYEPISLLCERKHIEGDAKEIISLFPNLTVYTGDREVLERLTGYKLTRGVLSAMKRPEPKSVAEVCSHASRVAVLEGVCDSTNVGAIFRSAAALGIEAVILDHEACDPLNRRALRVSMGSVMLVAWSRSDHPVAELRALGFKTIALALTDNSLPVDAPELKQCQRIALVLGTEGDGLREQTITSCDYTARIPMSHGVDSLNVAAASALAFWEFRNVGRNSVPVQPSHH